MFKKQLTPLTKGGKVTKHTGKGSQQAPMPTRKDIDHLATPAGNSINDYAKATPMANGMPTPGDSSGGGYGG
jgi:hypothetical protein